MTTTTPTPTDVADSTPPRTRKPVNNRLTTRGILASEWVKLRSLRATTATLASAGVVVLVIGLVFAGILGGVFTSGPSDEAAAFANDPTGATLQGAQIAQLIIGILGVLVITTEYASGTIRTTMAVVPRRLPVLWAKAAVIAATVLPLMLAAALGSFLVGQGVIANAGINTASLTDPGVLRAVAGTAGYLTGIALIGLSVGTLLRSTAGAITAMTVGLFALPELAALLLPSSWADATLKYLPSNAGNAFASVATPPELLTPGVAFAVFLAWVVIPLAAAAVVLQRRDVGP